MLAQFAVAGGGVVNYIEDVFSTWLYTGTGAAQTINNGLDLAGKGGMVWVKSRSAATDHFLFDTVRGALKEVNSNSTAAQVTLAASLTSFNANGFSLDSAAGVNTSADTYTAWTFRDQIKFFDVVTYTGTSVNRTIPHNLGAVPGCIMVKRTDTTGDWQVYHRSLANTQYMVLNSTAAVATGATRWNSTTPTDTVFSLGTDVTVNASGGTYVAFIFAHNAGGFGVTSIDNVISCGSYAGNGSATGPVVTLGYEPQWLMVKNTTGTGSWQMLDNMRGLPVGSADATLAANSAAAESSADYAIPTATGFQIVSTSTEVNTSAQTYIYVAVRRGPMRVPTTGTSVFVPVALSPSAVGTAVTTNFPVDIQLAKASLTGSGSINFHDKLRSVSTTATDSGTQLETTSAAAESTSGSWTRFWNSTGFQVANQYALGNNIYWNFRRAPSFVDEVCYTATGAATTVAHNLAAVPELMIVKSRSDATAWQVYSSALANTEYLVLNTTAAKATGATRWNSTTPTASVFSIGTAAEVNTLAATYVAYLFTSCPGVSKVGSYTGTGTTQTINCGFTAGSRFVMIKRTDSTGDWYVWDSARGIVAGNDPYLLLNSTVPEVTSTDYIDTAAAGFEITATAPAAINANGGSYIFLAIA